VDGLIILEKIKGHSRRGASRNLIKVSKRLILYKENPENMQNHNNKRKTRNPKIDPN
jgi:hypothetical protein